eukprot:gene16740-biopygen8280
MGCQRAPKPIFWPPNGHLLRPIGTGQPGAPGAFALKPLYTRDSGAGVARAIHFLAWGGAGVARAWRGRGAGMSCSPWGCCGPAGTSVTLSRGRWALGGPPGVKNHQNPEIFDFLGVPPGMRIRPRWGANGHRDRFFGRQMATFCVRSAPASPGARCICLGAAVYAGIRSRHTELKTCARAELAIPGAWGCCGPAG